MIGYTSDQLVSGFCKRGHKSSQKPLHKNTLADAVERLTTEELEHIFNSAVKRLWERGMFSNSKGVFALDASDLPTTRRYRGAGVRTVKREKQKRGQLVEVAETVYGFKLIALYEVELRQVVAVKVVPINPHDKHLHPGAGQTGAAQPGTSSDQTPAGRSGLPGWPDPVAPQAPARHRLRGACQEHHARHQRCALIGSGNAGW